MSLQDDKYDFTLHSFSGKPGFDCFEKNGSCFFLYNDEEGNACLYSQAYKSEKSRDKGMRSVIANAPEKKRIDKGKTDSGKPFFLLKAGNSLEIARSRPFDSVKEMEAKIKHLMAVSDETPVHQASAEKVLPSVSEKETEIKKTEAPMAKKETAGPPKMPKYSFRIDWYPESDSGKIEHFVSGDSRRFQGIDNEAIIGFLTEHLPIESPRMPVAETSTRPRIPAGYKIPGVKEETLKDLVLKIKGVECKGTVVKSLSDWSLELDIHELVKGKAQTCSATIFAKSLNTFQQEFLGQLEQITPLDGKVSVPLSSRNLKPGPYRLIARVSIKGGEKTAEGSRLVQIW